jgi:sRNA-binding regulator protein Hfq
MREKSQLKESTDTGNRRLIRPSLSEVKDQLTHEKRPPRQKRTLPPDQTHAEGFYYLKQMQNRTPMVLVLKDGEELHGSIEWYDKDCLKLNREGAPNLLVYKDSLKYLYKESDAVRSDGAGPNARKQRTNGAAES